MQAGDQHQSGILEVGDDNVCGHALNDGSGLIDYLID